MVDVGGRRVTRSVSNELQNRGSATQQGVSYQGLRNIHHDGPINYQSPTQQQQQQHNNHSTGQGQQQLPSCSSEDLERLLSQQLAVNGGGSTEGDSTYVRNTSEEMFLNNLITSGLAPGTPNMESLEFLDNLQPQPTTSPQTPRGDSEELFHNWLVQNSSQFQNGRDSPSRTENRHRQNGRRNDGQDVMAQQIGGPWVPRVDSAEEANLQTNSYLSEDISNVNSGQKPHRNSSKEKGKPITGSSLGQINDILWNTNVPMTRRRSSELLRRMCEKEGVPFPPSPGTRQRWATNGSIESTLNPAMTSLGIGNSEPPKDDPDSKPMDPQVLPAPPFSSAAPVNQNLKNQQQPPVEQYGKISNVVGLLKGSLERKKQQTQQQQTQQQQAQQQQTQQQQTQQQQMQQQQVQQPGVKSRRTPISPLQGKARQDQFSNGAQDLRQQMLEGGLLHPGQLQQNSLATTHSPTASSGAALSHSAGRGTSEGPSNSGVSVPKQGLKRGNADIYENGTTKTDNLKKPGHLTRAGSITSSLKQGIQLHEIDGATKKRRVERQRKMAEAKGRGNVPPVPADLQAAMKHCDALEKEVRSLKLISSFMNRKDSEQTKKIEELEQQNEELKEKNERLVEEMKRVSAMHYHSVRV